MLGTVSVVIFSFLFCSPTAGDGPYAYQEDYFDQEIDHFNFVRYGNRTFRQRFLYNDTFWDRHQAPVFLYVGNEGNIVNLWQGNVFIMNAAKAFNALVVFLEHRYYGESLPFGKDSFVGENIGLLSIDQALSDCAYFLKSFKKRFNAERCPVIAFGGSYGGMLSAYIRFKFPNLILGSVAASAPLLQTAGKTSGDLYFQAVTKDFRRVSPQCETMIRKGFIEVDTWAKSGPQGLAQISKMFRLCRTLEADDYDHFQRWLRNAFVNAAQMDYPYPSEPFPAYPVRVMCDIFRTSMNSSVGMYRASALFYNATETLKCFDIFDDFMICSDPTGCFNGSDGTAWDYQGCTEVNLEGSTNGVKDMFPVLPFTASMRDEYCLKKFKVVPRRDFLDVSYWGADISHSSNIVFSNGNLDPWAPGGILSNISDSIVAVMIEGGAHHFDFNLSPGMPGQRALQRMRGAETV